ncbi:HMG-Y-related protein A-like [Phragmites australis]|uniref:HMG-Y-related protein A-like n=1 Tax=Phragmites australis TaxID=29695 RepID=UPI002D79CEE7|nr:HMG-Y-related protein A-like [Phragmites australis]
MATSSSGDDSPHASSDLVPPSYPEMIVAAIASLAEENGSSQAAIARRIEAEARGDLPASHPALVAAHLSRMSAAGELVAVAGGKYALPPPPPPPPPAAPDSPAEDDDCPDEEAPLPVPQPPAKRGRGRPPKARPPGFPAAGSGAALPAPFGVPGAADSPAAAPRRRGRPPKPRDPHAPPKIPRPRGRPRKNPLPEGMMAPRPRPGAPTTAKPRPQFAEVGFV